jgi:hypothetical protein
LRAAIGMEDRIDLDVAQGSCKVVNVLVGKPVEAPVRPR